MADSSVAITAGAGTSIDTRTEATNGNHRQVVVVGDPSTNAGVAPVDATAGLKVDLGADNDVTVSGTVAATQSGTWNVGTVSTVTNVVHVDDNASTLSVDDGGSSLTIDNGDLTTLAGTVSASKVQVSDGGGSLTVDGTVAVSGTVTVDSELTTGDLDTGAGTDTRAVVGLVGAKSGGGVLIPGDATKGLAVDLTATGANTTALKVDGSAVTQPVSGTFWQATQPVSFTNQTVDLSKVAGTTTDTNSGNKSAGTMRVVLATDQPQLTNKLLVTPDANSAVNISQMNGVAVTMGNGASGTGVQRVTIASDSTGVIGATQSGTWTVQPGNTANTTPWLVTDTAATSGGLSIVTGSVGATATAIKASAGQLYGYHLFNTTAAVAYVQIFNTAAASVTLGTTSPVISIGIPASGGVTAHFDKGIAFGTAISFGCTTTRAGSTGATCDVNFFYK